MTITKHRLEALLAQSCPSFEISHHSQEWKEGCSTEPEQLHYLLASSFVRHLTDLNSQKSYDEFPKVFGLIEDLFLRGDDYVNAWVTVGLLEALQNRNLHPSGSAPDDFVRFLGPVATWWWQEIELFWSGQTKRIGSSGRRHPSEMGNSGSAILCEGDSG